MLLIRSEFSSNSINSKSLFVTLGSLTFNKKSENLKAMPVCISTYLAKLHWNSWLPKPPWKNMTGSLMRLLQVFRGNAKMLG